MAVNPSHPSREFGKRHKHGILTEISFMEISITILSCHQNLVGQGCTSGWTRRTIIGIQKGTQLSIAHSHVMQISGVSTLASIRLSGLRIFLNRSGASCRIRYHNLVPASRPAIINPLPAQTKSIWLRFLGYSLHGNLSLARIALRASLGEEPTEAQVSAKWLSIKPPGIRKALAERLQTDIRKAFNRGEEVRKQILPSALLDIDIRHVANSRLGNEMCFVRLRL